VKLYAEVPALRLRQLVRDALVLLWVALWVWIGTGVYDLVNRLQAPGRTMQQAGERFAETLDGLGRRLAEAPLFGEVLAAPLEAAAGAGRALEEAGLTQQEVVAELAFWLAMLLAAIPILLLLILYLPGRIRWVREAGAAQLFRLASGDLYVFALRAVANRPLDELRRATPDPGGDLASGDYQALAALELEALGLRVLPREEPD
jgi:hypothetical protein